MQDIALAFARNGFYVFPRYNTSDGPKNPYGWARNKPKSTVDQNKIIPASNDPEYVKLWARLLHDGFDSTLHSFGVLGLGCVILDLDVKNGFNGVEEFKLLKDKVGFPNPEFVVKSQSGGVHLYYSKILDQSDVGIKTLAGLSYDKVKYPGVDLRGDGGFVVGPTTLGSWSPGQYAIVKGSIGCKLSAAPPEFVSALSKTTFMAAGSTNALIDLDDGSTTSVMEKLKRGEIPDSLPTGQRNDGFFTYVSALRNKGFSKSTVKRMLNELIAVTEDRETLADSVDIPDMLDRLFSVNIDNPYDVCRDLYNYGLYRLTSYKPKIHYIMTKQNPYVSSRGIHDLTAMRQLLCKYERLVPQANGKDKLISPAALIDYTVPTNHDVTTLAFKPGSDQVFNDGSGRSMLNLWINPTQFITTDVDEAIWDEFMELMFRLFGDPDSKEFMLGLDFIAWIIQRPGIKPSISPFLMSSKRGVGKSLFMYIIMLICGNNLIGDSQARPFKINEISGRFFDPSRSSMILFDEVQFPVHRNMRQNASEFWMNLKNLITSDTYAVEIKGGDVFHLPNLGGVIMAGNAGGHFPIEEFDRRIWVIDNEAPLLEEGVCDRLFEARNSDAMRVRVRSSLITKLSKYTIKSDLRSMRAPMTAIKQEMFLATLDRLSEWFITHFSDPENMLARTPVVTKSTIIYLVETDKTLANTNYSEDPELAFRELRRSGLLRPIRVKSNSGLSRSLQVVAITRTGEVMESANRTAVYTSRDHGDLNSYTNDSIIQMFTQNVHTVRRWRDNMIAARKKALAVKIQI